MKIIDVIDNSINIMKLKMLQPSNVYLTRVTWSEFEKEMSEMIYGLPINKLYSIIYKEVLVSRNPLVKGNVFVKDDRVFGDIITSPNVMHVSSDYDMFFNHGQVFDLESMEEIEYDKMKTFKPLGLQKNKPVVTKP